MNLGYCGPNSKINEIHMLLPSNSQIYSTVLYCNSQYHTHMTLSKLSVDGYSLDRSQLPSFQVLTFRLYVVYIPGGKGFWLWLWVYIIYSAVRCEK